MDLMGRPSTTWKSGGDILTFGGHQAHQRIPFYNGTAAVSLGLLTGGHVSKLGYQCTDKSGYFMFLVLIMTCY